MISVHIFRTSVSLYVLYLAIPAIFMSEMLIFCVSVKLFATAKAISILENITSRVDMADWQYTHMQYYKICTHQAFLCRIRGIIGESNIWRVTLKMQLARFLIGGLSTVWKETHAYSLIGIH